MPRYAVTYSTQEAGTRIPYGTARWLGTQVTGTQVTGTLWLYMSAQAGTKEVAYTSLHMCKSTRPRGTSCSPSPLA